jgi:hypothetical protein
MEQVTATQENIKNPQPDSLDQRLATLEKHVAKCFNSKYERLMALEIGLSDMTDTIGEIPMAVDSLKETIYHAVRAADRLGRAWSIRNEKLFRQTMRSILEKSFGARVEELWIGGEQFDCLIIGDQHILVEISASVGSDIKKSLERKRQLYIDETGVVPARFILAVGSIYSRRAETLRAAGFDVVEPEEEIEE